MLQAMATNNQDRLDQRPRRISQQHSVYRIVDVRRDARGICPQISQIQLVLQDQFLRRFPFTHGSIHLVNQPLNLIFTNGHLKSFDRALGIRTGKQTIGPGEPLQQQTV